MKSFMAMALGLSLVLAGCSKDDDSPLAEFTGTYPIEVDARLENDHIISGLKVNLILSEEGGNFKASANLAEYGNIDIILSSLNSDLSKLNLGEEEDVENIRGYLFKVAEQTIQLSTGTVKIKGSPAEKRNGYDGLVVKGNLGNIELRNIVILLEGVDLPVVVEIESDF
jgi:hypothetical protein